MKRFAAFNFLLCFLLSSELVFSGNGGSKEKKTRISIKKFEEKVDNLLENGKYGMGNGDDSSSISDFSNSSDGVTNNFYERSIPGNHSKDDFIQRALDNPNDFLKNISFYLEKNNEVKKLLIDKDTLNSFSSLLNDPESSKDDITKWIDNYFNDNNIQAIANKLNKSNNELLPLVKSVNKNSQQQIKTIATQVIMGLLELTQCHKHISGIKKTNNTKLVWGMRSVLSALFLVYLSSIVLFSIVEFIAYRQSGNIFPFLFNVPIFIVAMTFISCLICCPSTAIVLAILRATRPDAFDQFLLRKTKNQTIAAHISNKIKELEKALFELSK